RALRSEAVSGRDRRPAHRVLERSGSTTFGEETGSRLIQPSLRERCCGSGWARQGSASPRAASLTAPGKADCYGCISRSADRMIETARPAVQSDERRMNDKLCAGPLDQSQVDSERDALFLAYLGISMLDVAKLNSEYRTVSMAYEGDFALAEH